jgi:hypothetical protein
MCIPPRRPFSFHNDAGRGCAFDMTGKRIHGTIKQGIAVLEKEK